MLLCLFGVVLAGAAIADWLRPGTTVVTIRDVAKGAEIRDADIRETAIPHVLGALTNIAELHGFIALEPIASGGPVFEHAVGRQQAVATATIRGGGALTADNVAFKVMPYVADAMTSPASLRRRAKAEIPAGTIIRESMVLEASTAPSFAAATGDSIVGCAMRELAVVQSIRPGDVRWSVPVPQLKGKVLVTTVALAVGDGVRRTDVAHIRIDSVVASYRVTAGSLRPRCGAKVTLLVSGAGAGKKPVSETVTLLSIGPTTGDSINVVVALSHHAATRLASFADRPVRLLATPGVEE